MPPRALPDAVPASGPEVAPTEGRPIVGVGAVVLRGSEVLLVRRGTEPMAGRWSIPGGKQERGETVFEAAAREVREETGVEIEVIALVDVVDAIHRRSDGGVRSHYTLVDVVARWRGGRPVAASDADDARWVELDEVEGLGMWAETTRVIRAGAALMDRAEGPSPRP